MNETCYGVIGGVGEAKGSPLEGKRLLKVEIERNGPSVKNSWRIIVCSLSIPVESPWPGVEAASCSESRLWWQGTSFSCTCSY